MKICAHVQDTKVKDQRKFVVKPDIQFIKILIAAQYLGLKKYTAYKNGKSYFLTVDDDDCAIEDAAITAKIEAMN